MARKRVVKKRSRLLLVLFGVGLSIPLYYAADFGLAYLRGWIGQIVISAVHQHWLWEQQNQLFKPATGLLEVPQGVIH